MGRGVVEDRWAEVGVEDRWAEVGVEDRWAEAGVKYGFLVSK